MRHNFKNDLISLMVNSNKEITVSLHIVFLDFQIPDYHGGVEDLMETSFNKHNIIFEVVP